MKNLNKMCEVYYDNGQIMKRFNCKNNKFEGLYEEWYENGELMYSSVFGNNRICINCM